MRPLQLTMTAFGPYRDTEWIDFTKLEDRRLFVISGNTGAGKTTIFDAICYALYGVASGEDRAEPRMLRSHFADDDTHTVIEFAFAVGRKTYSVYRQMAHRKGANKSETGGKVELYETTSGQAVPLVDRFTVAEVNTKLESIIGLTREQFSQIVMLPQGEFRKLLTSDTENKEDILRRIFRTGLYQKLEEHFYANSRELKEQHREAQSRVDIYVRQIQDTLPQREESELITILSQSHHSAAQVAEGLSREVDFYQARVLEAEQAKNKLQQQLQQEEARYHAALLLDGRFAQLAERRVLLEQYHLQREEMEKKEAQLTLAEKAARLDPYEEHTHAITADLRVKQEQYAEKLQTIQTAETAFQSATERYQAELAREGERKEAEHLLQQLIELTPIVDHLAARKEEVTKLAHQHDVLHKQLSEMERKLQSLREGKLQYSEQIKQIEVQIGVLSDKLKARDQMRLQAKLLRDVIELNRQIEDYTRMEVLQKKEVERFKDEHDRLERLWIEGQASMLAAHLQNGKPCPVCGSEHHPEKAMSGTSLPSRDQLQAAKEELRHIEQQWMTAQAQVAAARTHWDQYIGEMTEYGLSMKDATEQYQQLVTAGKKLNEEIEHLEKQQGTLQKLRQGLEKCEQDLERLSQERDQLIVKQKNLAMDYSSKQSLLAKELEQIPESWQTPAALLRQRTGQQKHVDQLAAKWLQAQNELQQYQTQFAEEKASGAQMARQLEELEANWLKAKERFNQELEKSSFSSIEQYQEVKLPESVRTNYRMELDTYQSTLRSLEQQVNELERELAGRTRPDLELLRHGLAQCKEQLEQVQLTLQTAERYRQEAKRLHNALVSADQATRELESRLEQILDIYHMLKGDNALKISFERYILIEFLEQIIHAANVRLQELSNGQFVLQRSDRLESRGRQSGLGFDVYDAYTGQNRDVKTLSGGEKFNASLCLALGMTDVIQAHQGGVSIEMMFIDEGFGSLDEDALNKAIAALVDLQRAGRMIGVISHVEELKLAFPAVLEVNKTREGHSRTQMILK